MLPAIHRKLFFILLAALAGCVESPVKAPVDESFDVPSRRIERHVVSPGETLFSIAWSYGVDYRQLAATNKIAPPYKLVAGRELRLPKSIERFSIIANDVSIPASRRPPPVVDGRAKAAHSAEVQAAGNERVSNSPSAIAKVLEGWRWPAAGSVIDTPAAYAPQRRGIDIRGELGEPVYAANSGKVVYAGSGLVGYGNLLIIKHNDRYLSAYAHNNRLLVGEGKIVKAGDQVAEIGDSGTDSAKLHFEIRCDGKPIDPLRMLPPR
jgi:lipoprotein NlpD